MADTYPKNTIDDNGLKKVWDMVMNRLGLKVDKEAGKGLSTNDYDNTAKGKVDALGSASTKNVATTGDASSNQVVMGNDSRLLDSRTPKSHTHTKNDITDFAHTHPLSIVTDTGTSAITLAHGGKYKLTAGGNTLVFTMPSDNDHYSWSDITDKPSTFPPSAHTHTVSQITDFPSTMPPSSHTHGNIQNGGTLQTNDIAIANGDKLVITDSSDSSKIARASIAFDGSTATKCLTQKGTWESFTNNAGTVTSIKVGSTSYSPSSGIVSLPAYPTTLPASDVYAWAKASSKPSYTLDEVSDGSTRKLANYLPLAGGTMTGNLTPDGGIKWTSTGLPEHTNPSYLMVIDGFEDGGRTKWANKSNVAVGKAEKLSTARSIALGGDFTGSTNFDGSANIVIDSNFYYSSINSGNRSNYPWHRIACCSGKTGQYTDVDAILDIRHTHNGGRYGRIKISLRTSSTNSGVLISATWLYRYGFSADSIKIACWGVTGQAVYADVFINVTTYARAKAYQVEGSRAWTLVTSTEVDNTTASDPKTSTECWASIEAAGTALHNKAYTSIVSATDGGIVSYANNAGSIAWSGVSDKPTSFTPSSHTHGNIQNGGTLQTNDITIASGDKLVVTDSSDSSKIARASISFDGSTATKCLTQKGTWEAFASSNTDTKVTQTEMAGGDADNYYEVLLSGTADDTTRTEGVKKSNKLVFNAARGIMYCYNKSFKTGWDISGGSGESTVATVARLTVGNNTASGTAGNRYGILELYSKQTYYADLKTADTYTANRTFTLPDKTGTIALTSDIPDFTLTAMSTITTVGNAYYTFNGTNGVHYGYYKYGRIVVAVWNVYCPATATEAAPQKIGSGFPKPANGVGLSLALGSQNLNRGAAIGIIDSNGDAFAMGGCNTNGSYYYGVCTYIS